MKYETQDVYNFINKIRDEIDDTQNELTRIIKMNANQLAMIDLMEKALKNLLSETIESRVQKMGLTERINFFKHFNIDIT